MPQDGPYFSVSVPSTSVIDLNPSAADLPRLRKQSVMSPQSELNTSKKRKLDRACDFCRRRKTKCDGPSKSNNVCSNCIQNHNRCTYVEGSRPRGPPKAYVTSLEDRLERMEAWLKRLRPEEDFSEQLGPPVYRDSWKYDSPATAPKHKGDPTCSQSTTENSFSRGCRGISPRLNLNHVSQSEKLRQSRDRSHDEDSQSSDAFASSDDDEYTETTLTRGLKRLTLQGLEQVVKTDPNAHSQEPERDSQMRFHGKSSSFRLIGPTREFRKQHLTAMKVPVMDAPPLRRQFFWNSPLWETSWEGIHLNNPSLFRSLTESFPPPDLAQKLIDCYFYNVNFMFPILHRVTFDRQWADGLYFRDAYFAALCMAIFSVASRWSNDPRVLGPPSSACDQQFSTKNPPWGLAGWNFCSPVLEFFHQRKSVLYPACLFEMQLHCLLAIYFRVQPCSASLCFTSIGLRKAQDIGIHRRKVYNETPTVEDELWKRSFWILAGIDRVTAASFGRSCATTEEDIDVEMPIEVDDEYWTSDIPGMAFKQPHGIPSTITAFNLWIKMTQITAFAVRTIYAVDKTKVAPLGLGGPQWRQQVVRQLNTAMSEWADSVPEHLKWSARMDNPVFANQSATLFLTYYSTQILIYAPFIPPCKLNKARHSRKASILHGDFPFPALSICINAAKACLGILETQLAAGMTDVHTAIVTSQRASSILVAHIWRLKAQERDQLSEGVHDSKPVPGQTIPDLLQDVNKFMEILRNISPRYPLVHNILIDLAKALPTNSGNGNDGMSPSDPACIQGPNFLLPRQPDPVPPAFPQNSMEFSVEQLDPYGGSRRYSHYPHTSPSPVDGTMEVRPGSVASSASWPCDTRRNEFPSEPNHQLTWTPYYDTPSDTPIPRETRSAMPINHSKRRSATLQLFNLERHESIVKRETLDDYNVIHQLPSIRQSIFGPSHLQTFTRTPDVYEGWYVDNPRHHWSVQSNARATFTVGTDHHY